MRRRELVIDGGRAGEIMGRTVRFSRGVAKGTITPPHGKAVDLGFQTFASTRILVDLMAEVIELTAGDLEDARDLVANFNL